MNLLHITATHLNTVGGVPAVLRGLVEAQNKITGLSAKVLSLVATVDHIDSKFFNYTHVRDFDGYLDEFMPDVVILHSFFYLEYNSVVESLTKRGIKYYIEPHGSFGRRALRKSWLKKTIANNTIFRKLIRNAHGYVFLNNAELADSKYRSENDVVIPNGINSNLIVKEYLSRKSSLYYVGRYDIKGKGLDGFLSALKLLDLKKGFSFDVHLWGKGKESEEKKIKSVVTKIKTFKCVFDGPISGNDKDEKLEQLGPMILTSRHEGMPMTILEAWMYGNPVIVTPGTNMAEEVERNKLGWVAELNGESIAETIQNAVLDYQNNREYYIRRCKAYVMENYSWDKVAELSYLKLCNNS